jgi:hypothetical protein
MPVVNYPTSPKPKAIHTLGTATRAGPDGARYSSANELAHTRPFQGQQAVRNHLALKIMKTTLYKTRGDLPEKHARLARWAV